MIISISCKFSRVKISGDTNKVSVLAQLTENMLTVGITNALAAAGDTFYSLTLTQLEVQLGPNSISANQKKPDVFSLAILA